MKKIALFAALVIAVIPAAWFVTNNIKRNNLREYNSIHRAHLKTPSGKMLNTAD